ASPPFGMGQIKTQMRYSRLAVRFDFSRHTVENAHHAVIVRQHVGGEGGDAVFAGDRQMADVSEVTLQDGLFAVRVEQLFQQCFVARLDGAKMDFQAALEFGQLAFSTAALTTSTETPRLQKPCESGRVT